MSPSYLFVFITLCAINGILGDIYMQNPRGNNDRLNENGDRNNDRRLFDSQNNARGGYCWGPELTYYEGSILSVEWTNQHACGNDNTKCQLVLQYMCSDDSDGADESLIIRDGLTTTTIPANDNPAAGTNYYNYKDPNVGDGSTFRYGMNEPFSNYKSCRERNRNGGLFSATQTVGTTQGASATRQNRNADQYGFECAEERDYYPYWHPSPWKDIAVLVDSLDECDFYKTNSQNVLGKNFCNGTTPAQRAPNMERECITANGKWETKAPWGLPPPVCQLAPFNRDNHLGNSADGFANTFNWTIPRSGDEECILYGRCACVLRIRYNITVGEVDSSLDNRNNSKASPVTNDPTVEVYGYNYTLALDTAQTGRTFQDRSFMFRIAPRPDGVDGDAKIYNLNVRGKRGNIVQTYPATEYDFVPTFLEVNKDDFVHFQWTGCDTNPGGNAGEGKTSTDRSNIVQIASMTMNYPMKESQLTNTNALFTDPKVRARMAQIDQENCLNYADLLKKNGGNANNVAQDNQNCMVLNSAPTPRFTGGLVRMSNVGSFHYMSTRNNNFSNRSQKASIKVTESKWPAWKSAVIAVSGVVAFSGAAAAGCFVYAKKNPHSKVADYMQKIPGMKGRI